MKNKQFSFVRDGYILLMMVLGAGLNIAVWYWLRHALVPHSGFVVLHFTTASGVDLIGERSDLYQVPLWAAAITIANLAFARAVFTYDALASYILVSVAPLINIIAFLNLYLLVWMSR